MSVCERPILYVIVVGFHHKKGCQVEYSFPPLVVDAPNECPPGWKYLPTLALPDGSHNYDEDTVFFHLPSLTDPKKTVYGISCYRQIPVEKIKNRTADITRGTVQKSVCVLSKLPLYGYIQVKIVLITHAYFDEGDFSKVSLLEDTYHHLNSVLIQSELSTQTFVGLSARDFVLQWRHKVLLLFKLLLLEKKIIFHRSPVQSLCSSILTLLSLHPLMIEKGLEQSASVKLSRPMSPMPDFFDEDSPNCSPKITSLNLNENPCKNETDCIPLHITVSNSEEFKQTTESSHTLNDQHDLKGVDIENANIYSEITTEIGIEVAESNNLSSSDDFERSDVCQDVTSEVESENVQNNLNLLTQVDVEICGLPLPLFTKGYLCLPYISLPYLDLLSDVKVRGYVVGATNILFKQKRYLSEIFVDIESSKIECQDAELRKQLHLTTEDLRFADYIVKQVTDERHDVFLDGVGWEGGDEWIRTQFKIYMLYLLKTASLPEGSRELEHFNGSFMTAWKETHNFKMWQSKEYSGMITITAGHPFAGQLSVSDMKLRFAHTMQNTEGGRKLNQAMASTGRVVATTSKAVGGALSQAKGAFSTWWSNLLVSPDVQKCVIEATSTDTNQEKEDEGKTNNHATDDAESSLNVLDSIHKHLVNGSVVQENCETENINAVRGYSNVQSKETLVLSDIEDIENNVDKKGRKPGEIHTV